MPYDWSQFSVRIGIKTPPENIYQYWSTQNGIEYWFLRSAEFKRPDGTLRAPGEQIEAGDTYKWHWHGYTDDVVEYGEILEANGKDRVKFRFGSAGNCTVTVSEKEGETIVELVQDDIPTDEKSMQQFHVGCQAGWTFHFTNFKSILEGGLDLRNKNEKITGVINS
ncbi:MAG: SRPBCC domain-containing protein [Bacteroidota bacterium]